MLFTGSTVDVEKHRLQASRLLGGNGVCYGFYNLRSTVHPVSCYCRIGSLWYIYIATDSMLLCLQAALGICPRLPSSNSNKPV